MVEPLRSLWLQQIHPCKQDVRWQEEGVPSKAGGEGRMSTTQQIKTSWTWEEQMREHWKKEKELSRGQNLREMGKTVLITSKNLGVVINITLPIRVWDIWLLDVSEESGHILAAALLVLMFPEYLLDFSSFKNENVL